MEREQFVAGLREFASFLEEHPEVAVPNSMMSAYVFPAISELATYARAFGKCRKVSDESFFNLTKTFGSAVEFQAAWYRERVCERVVVGKRTREEPVMQEVGKRTVTEDIVEWKCPRVLEPLAPPDILELAEKSEEMPF